MIRLKKHNRLGIKQGLALAAIMAVILGVIALSCLQGAGDSGGEGLYTLPVADSILPLIPEKVEINDQSSQSQNKDLSLYQYVSFSYQNGMLSQEAAYDKQGNRTELRTLVYDTAGNVLREDVEGAAQEVQTYRHTYEYDADAFDSVVHEEIHLNGQKAEDHYLRYDDEGWAGVNYYYKDELIDGEPVHYCYSKVQFVEDEEGRTLSMFQSPNFNTNTIDEAWNIQWSRRENRLANFVQYYWRHSWKEGGLGDWYLYREEPDREQINLFEVQKDTGRENLILQMERHNDSGDRGIYPTFYKAAYGEDRLLWQMVYRDGRLFYYNACAYDGEGRLLSAVEYGTRQPLSYVSCNYDTDDRGRLSEHVEEPSEQETPQAVFHRYEYQEEDRMEKYSYYIEGDSFTQPCGMPEDGMDVTLSLSGGRMSQIQMEWQAGLESYAFHTSGHRIGELEGACIMDEILEGEEAVLQWLSDGVEAYGFY